LQGSKDNAVRIIQRISKSRNSVLKRGWVEHGRDVVHDRPNIGETLADAGVVQIPADIAEVVGREKHVVWHEPLLRLG